MASSSVGVHRFAMQRVGKAGQYKTGRQMLSKALMDVRFPTWMVNVSFGEEFNETRMLNFDRVYGSLGAGRLRCLLPPGRQSLN